MDGQLAFLAIFFKFTRQNSKTTETMNHLKNATISVLNQLEDLISKLDDKEYAFGLKTFHGSSIGQHVRHVIEFYQCLLVQNELLDYDSRQRDLELENRREKAISELKAIKYQINTLEKDTPVFLNSNFSNSSTHVLAAPSSLLRELAYNLEHTVHHMAILRIGVEHNFENIKMPENFGVAMSTQRNNSTQASSQSA